MFHRRKRQYRQQDLNQLLSQYQINSDDLIPPPLSKKKKQDSTISSSSSSNSSSLPSSGVKGRNRPQPTFPTYLPLEVFDNTEFDCRTPEEWLELGIGTYVHMYTACVYIMLCVSHIYTQ